VPRPRHRAFDIAGHAGAAHLGPCSIDAAGGRDTDLALQGRDGEAKARAQLEPRVWSGRASPEEIRMLRAICKHMGDRACIDRASALLAGQK